MRWMLENLDKILPCGGRQAVRPAGVDDAAVKNDGVAAPEGRVNVWAKQLPSLEVAFLSPQHQALESLWSLKMWSDAVEWKKEN